MRECLVTLLPLSWQPATTTDLARGAAAAIPQLLVQSFTNSSCSCPRAAWLPPVGRQSDETEPGDRYLGHCVISPCAQLPLHTLCFHCVCLSAL